MANYTAPTNKNQVLTLNYTGTVDAISIAKSGLYKFDIYGGAGGGDAWTGIGENYDGGGCKGGRAVGYALLKKGTTIYACIGGGGTVRNKKAAPGGFNGGAPGSPYLYNNGNAYADWGYAGGGASHIALISGTLAQIGASRKNQILIVAGGGGAGNPSGNYGTGGGLNGGPAYGGYNRTPTPGTQASAGISDYQYGTQPGFGTAGAAVNPYDNMFTRGGGGGLYGGGSVSFSQGGSTVGIAAGGSGYIGGVPARVYKGISYTPSCINGVRTGHGIGYITFMELGLPTLFYGDREIDALYYGDKEIDTLYCGDRGVN